MMATPRNHSWKRRGRCASNGLVALSLIGCLLISGCHRGARRNTELLESRIRNQEETIASLRRNLSDLEAEHQAARREAKALRASAGDDKRPLMLAEHAETQLRVSTISINTFLSGGLDRDAEYGDELLTVLVVPQDTAGDTLRASGRLEIDAIDFAAPVDEQRIGHWEFDRAKTQELWHFGLIGRGIQVTVPWQRLPISESVTVHARLTMPDGRQFDATEELRVQPPEPGESRLPVGIKPPSVEPAESAFPPIESLERNGNGAVPDAIDSTTPGFGSIERTSPATNEFLQPPLLPDLPAERMAGLMRPDWQSTAE